MMKSVLLAALLIGVGVLSSGLIYAADDTGAATKSPATEKKARAAPIYGSQLMTPEERAEHRAKMRAAKTREEREKIRAEHHQAMQERAKERGVTLPDSPPMHQRRGMGPGMGPGPGGDPKGPGPQPN